MFILNNVNKSYQTPSGTVYALHNIDLSIPSGQIFGIIGTSGAGKSTLLRCLNGLELPSSGHVMFEGNDITELSPSALRHKRQQIGMIFQHFNLLSSRTVFDNIALPLEIAHTAKDKIASIIEPLLELTQLSDKRDVYPAQLSGGQKQRVAIARALVNQPKVLLCDEATSALDPHTTENILTLLQDINQKLGLTIILITHEMEVIKTICDHVAVLEKGQLIENAKVIDFFTNPQSPSSKKLVAKALKQELSERILHTLESAYSQTTVPVIRIIFQGAAAAEPIIAKLVKEFDVNVNILQANIEFIQDISIGVMVITTNTDEQQSRDILQFLQSHQLNAEIIGYVKH